jgi:hypothetical protein
MDLMDLKESSYAASSKNHRQKVRGGGVGKITFENKSQLFGPPVTNNS